MVRACALQRVPHVSGPLLEEHSAQRCRQGFGFAAQHTRELAITGTIAVSKHVGVRNASTRFLQTQGNRRRDLQCLSEVRNGLSNQEHASGTGLLSAGVVGVNASQCPNACKVCQRSAAYLQTCAVDCTVQIMFVVTSGETAVSVSCTPFVSNVCVIPPPTVRFVIV